MTALACRCDICTAKRSSAWLLEEARMERVEHEAQAVHMAVSGFILAIMQATSVDEALQIQKLIAEVLASLEACERAALEKADSF